MVHRISVDGASVFGDMDIPALRGAAERGSVWCPVKFSNGYEHTEHLAEVRPCDDRVCSVRFDHRSYNIGWDVMCVAFTSRRAVLIRHVLGSALDVSLGATV